MCFSLLNGVLIHPPSFGLVGWLACHVLCMYGFVMLASVSIVCSRSLPMVGLVWLAVLAGLAELAEWGG